MTTTMISYQAVTRNLTKSLARTAAQTDVAAATAYFNKTIGTVKSLDDFMKDDRLYRYAVEAYGLGDMAYAKAFMRKVLEGGVGEGSFASRLSDRRYREFAAAFNFSVEKAGTTYFQTNIAKVKSVTAFTDKSGARMFDYAIEAFGLKSIADTPKEKEAIKSALLLGDQSPLSFPDPAIDKAFRAFLKAFDFSGKGMKATSDKAAMQAVVERHNAVIRADQAKVTVEKYTRQRLESDAGEDNENVRLALYFQRKAPTLKNAYEVLADRALLKVVQTALGISASTSAMPIDRQAEMISKKLDFKTLKDPEGVKRFLTRFTALADLEAAEQSGDNGMSILMSRPAAAGVSVAALYGIQNLRLGGR